MGRVGAGWHEMARDLAVEDFDGERDWTYAAERGIVLGAERRLELEVEVDKAEGEQ